MKIDIGDIEEVEVIKKALMCAIAYTNARLKLGVDSSHPERRPTSWWDNFKHDVEVAKTLSTLLDKIEKEDTEASKESEEAK